MKCWFEFRNFQPRMSLFIEGDPASIGDGGGGDPVDPPVDPGADPGSDPVDPGADPADPQNPDPNADPAGDPTDPAGQIPYAQLKAHVEELKKTNPALAKELKTIVFAMDAFKKEVPGGITEVRQLKQTVDELGGAEGIEKINSQRQEWNEIDTMFENADPKVFDFYIKSNPEAFSAIIPKAVDRLAEVNREAYNHMLSGPFVATLDAWKFGDTLERLAENLSLIVDDKGNKLCTREIHALQQLGQRYDGLRQLAQKAPVAKNDDAAKKLADERAAVAQERAKVHAEYVSNATQIHAQKQYETLIASESRNQKLNLETLKSAGSFERFQRQIDQQIAQEIVKDKAAVQKIQASIQAGRRDEAIKLSNAKFDAVAGKVVQQVVREWATLMNPRGVSAKANGNGNGKQPPPTGVKQLTEPPDLSLVDKKDPNWRDNYMMHSKATLTTGQRVQW